MPDINKRHIQVRVPLECCRMVEKKYRFWDDSSDGVAYIRALEDATRDVELTPEDYEIIMKWARANSNKRKGKLK